MPLAEESEIQLLEVRILGYSSYPLNPTWCLYDFQQLEHQNRLSYIPRKVVPRDDSLSFLKDVASSMIQGTKVLFACNFLFIYIFKYCTRIWIQNLSAELYPYPFHKKVSICFDRGSCWVGHVGLELAGFLFLRWGDDVERLTFQGVANVCLPCLLALCRIWRLVEFTLAAVKGVSLGCSFQSALAPRGAENLGTKEGSDVCSPFFSETDFWRAFSSHLWENIVE